MMKILTLGLVGAVMLAGCAPSPQSIAATPMGNAYEGITCSQARTLLTTERTKLEADSQRQRNAAVGDAIGVFLILVPVSSLTGNNRAGEIAASKGKIAALEARMTGC